LSSLVQALVSIAASRHKSSPAANLLCGDLACTNPAGKASQPVDICDLDYVIAGGGHTNTLIARRITGRWRGIGAHACSHVECRAHYAVVIRNGGK
jgi:hypothetical protein